MAPEELAQDLRDDMEVILVNIEKLMNFRKDRAHFRQREFVLIK